jgi:hypothetical protein
MSKHKIYFYGEDSGSYKPRLEVFVGQFGEIIIRIEDTMNLNDFQIMSLDKSTSIKFAKTLRTEINKIKE